MVCAVEHVLEIGVQFESALPFHNAFEVNRSRVFEGPLLEITLDAFVSGVFSNDGTELIQEDFAFAIRSSAISPVGHIVVGVGGQRLFTTVTDKVEVATVGPIVRMIFGFIEFFRNEFGLNP